MKSSVWMRLCSVFWSLGCAGTVWAQGIPMDQWTPDEREVIESARKQGVALTPEQAELTIKTMRDQVARTMGAIAGMQATSRLQMQAGGMVMHQPTMPAPAAQAPQQAPSVATAPSEAQLVETMGQWPGKPETFSVKQRRDGFEINGQPILDPQGRIFSYAINAVTGATTYAIQGGQGVTVKAVGPAAPHPTQTIATAVQGARGWEVTTVTGQRLAGDTLTVLSDGVLVGRSSAAFRYRIGEGVRSIAIPNGYFLAPLQNGDIGSTGFVLLEKEGAAPTGKGNPLMELISATQSLGAMVGMGRKDDYALMDMQTGKLLHLNIPADGKTVALMSECRKRNWILNECKKMQTYESVYTPEGFKNNMHYFWKVRWFPTSEGPVALTQEDGVTTIYITDLRTGKKVQAFNRALGIANWDVEQHGNGALEVKAQLAFEWQQIPDVTEFLKNAQDVNAAKPAVAREVSNSEVASQ